MERLKTRFATHYLLWLPALLVLLLYLPVLQGGLVWDDPLFLEHPLYRNPENWVRALGSPFLLSPNYYRPLAVGTFLLGGSSSGLQHLVNLLLHGLNTALVTLLAARLAGYGRDKPGARLVVLATGLLYGAHPALVEGVAFISSRFDLLVTTFLLLALLADLALRGRRWLRPALVGLAVFLATLSKEMAAAILVVLPLWHLGTWRLAASEVEVANPQVSSAGASQEAAKPAGRPRGWAYLLGLAPGETLNVYLATLLGLGGYLALRAAALGNLYLPAGSSLAVGSPWQHVLLIGRSLAEYALLVAWPFTTLRPIHYSPFPLPLESPASWLGLLLSLVLLVGLAWWVRRDRLTGWLAAAGLVALLPVLNLLPLELGGGAFIAERFLVFPLALLALSAGLLVSQRGFQPVLGLWLVAALAVVQLTVPHWRSEGALWEWGLRRAPLSPLPYTNLALAAINQGDPPQGLALADRALELDPRESNAHNQRGLALFHLGDYAAAEAAFARAIELEPGDALYRSNLAGALREQGRLEEAERVLLDEALQIDPNLGMAHFNLGLVYLAADRPDLAIPALTRAGELLPPGEALQAGIFLEQASDPARWLRLGDLLLANDEAQGALQAFAQAEQFGAEPLDAAVGRSAALIALEQLDQAEALLRAALLIAPEDARLYNNLGLVAQLCGQLETAQTLFTRASELAPGWDLPRHNLEALQP